MSLAINRPAGTDTVFPVAFFKFFPLPLYLSLAAMDSDPSSDSDDEYFTMQLDGSDSFPRAQKVVSFPLRLDVGIDNPHSDQTILRQTFAMRRHHNVQHGCKLMNPGPAESIDLE